MRPRGLRRERCYVLVIALLHAGQLDCAATHVPPAGSKPEAPAATAKAADGHALGAVLTVSAEGQGRYRIAYESRVEQIVDVSVGGARIVCKRRLDGTTDWYYREWRKDRSQRRTNGFFSNGDCGYSQAVLGGRVLRYRESDGHLLASARLTATERDGAWIVDGGGAGPLVVAERAQGLALVQLSDSDLSVVRQAIVPGRFGKADTGFAVADGHVFVVSLAPGGLRVCDVRKADLALVRDTVVPFAGAESTSAREELWVMASDGGRWLAAQLDEQQRLLVIDTADLRVVRDLPGVDAAYEFSTDERVLMIGLACASSDCDVSGEAYVYLDREAPALRVPYDGNRSGSADEYTHSAMAVGFAWAVSADLKLVRRWDYDDLSRARTYPIASVLAAAPHSGLEAEYSAESGRVWNYPLSIAFDRRGELLAAEWDGRELLLSRVREHGAETLLREPAADVRFLDIDASSDALVVVAEDGTFTLFDLSATPVRRR